LSSDNFDPSVIPEHFKIALKLEEIFTPGFRQLRDEAYTVDGEIKKDRIFVHYTSAEAALNIIRDKRLWLRNSTCMSDFTEVDHGFNIVRNFFGDGSEDQKRFTKMLEACAEGTTKAAIELFSERLPYIMSSTYIASFALHDSPREDSHGRLSMWRAFGGNAGSVALLFRVPWYKEELYAGIRALNVVWGPVRYGENDEFKKEFETILENISRHHDLLTSLDNQLIVRYLLNMLLFNTVCSKHPGFREEKEWRVIYFADTHPSPLMEPEIRAIHGFPQKIYKLPLDREKHQVLTALDLSVLVDRVIIGPSEYAPAVMQAFIEELSRKGIVDASKRVTPSYIPIR
jgi:hypothetical protein